MKVTLSKSVYNELLDRLLNNKMLPGQLINRRQVADELNVSVAPVLEAMLQLENEGFLETLPRKGTQVRIIRKDDILGQLIVREAIECQAARMYCGDSIINNMEQLLELATEVDKANEKYLDDWKIEIVFHRELVDLVGSAVLTSEFDRVMRLNVFYGMNSLIPVEKRTKRDNHIRLLKNLSTQNTDEAEKVMREHLKYGKDYIFGNRKGL